MRSIDYRGRGIPGIRTCMVGAVFICALHACTPKTPAVASVRDGDTVKVIDVIKGDELKIAHTGAEARLRLVGVYAFSGVIDDAKVQAQGEAAKAYLAKLVQNQRIEVTLNDPPKDPHGRYLGYAAVGNTDVGQQLIGEGHAIVYTEFPFTREAVYMQAETLARSTGRFVWGDKALHDKATGLRRQWQAQRKAEGTPLNDPLL